jgi:hypothetical protein
MDGQTINALIDVALAAIGLSIVYWGVKRSKRNLLVEVLDCSHGIGKDDCAFHLNVSFRVHNNGDKNSTLTSLKVSFVDPQNSTQQKIERLKQDVAGKSTGKLDVSFTLSRPFPNAEVIPCRFVLRHTFGKRTFVADSEKLAS